MKAIEDPKGNKTKDGNSKGRKHLTFVEKGAGKENISGWYNDGQNVLGAGGNIGGTHVGEILD